MDKEQKYKELYKKELDLLTKYIGNDYIYNFILHYKTIKDGITYKLNSNINIYEMLFLDRLIRLNNAKDVLEIGCAHGTSAMVILNALINTNGGKLTSVDPFQSAQWSNVGAYNANKIIEQNKTDKIIKHEVIEKFSSKALDIFINNNKYFDVIFIDGSHGFLDVVIDIFCSIKILKKGGYLILDDVLHTGVKMVVDELKHFNNIEKIHLKLLNEKISIEKSSYKYTSFEKSFLNPRTMYAYIKL
jgi:predicted O-methyltransferase YrrM